MAGKKKMAVVRGGHPRMAEIYFYSNFKKLDVRFIGDKKTGWVIDNKIPENISYVNLPLKPTWGFDPITFFLGSLHTHRAWKNVDNLESFVKDVDVINISDIFYFYSGQCARLAKKFGKKLVPVVWENIPNHPSTYIPPYSFNVRSVLETADLFIARSQKARGYLESIGVSPSKIKVIYKGINLKNFSPLFKKKSGKTKILYVGQLVPAKGVNVLLDAFIKLYKEFKNIELWICARSYGEPIEERVRSLTGRYPVIWMGHIPYDKLPEIYRQCDIYCQLSQDWKYLGLLPGGNEWFSYSILEAMASGLPIIATNVGGIPEQVGKENILVEQKNSEVVYKALKKLVLNPEKRIEIGKKNVLRAKSLFDIVTQAKKTEEAILDIL